MEMKSVVPAETSNFISSRGQSDHSLKPTVLVIVTGGTICMTNTGINDSLRPASIAEQLYEMVNLTDSSLPKFDVLEWEDLVDSSEIILDHWIQIAKDIEQRYHQYDGFVVLHGTDTLAYTASALSFMLENVSKPIILTGSMLPIFHNQTDARKNFSAALMISAYSEMTEVCVLFGSRLMRGNRSRKLDCSQMDAFNSPNFPALGSIGVDVTIDDRLLLTPSKRGFRIFPHFCMNIVIVTITPGFPTSLLQQLFASPTRPLAVILQLYGSGTAPVKDGMFIDAIQAGIRDGIEVICVSQCPSGTCSLLTYENGAILHHQGVIEGKDLTPEAAFAKLAYLMGKGYSGEALRGLMERDIRGEVTECPVKLTGQASLHSIIRTGTPVATNARLASICNTDGNYIRRNSNFIRFESALPTQTLSTPLALEASAPSVDQQQQPQDNSLNKGLGRTEHAEMRLTVHTLKAVLDRYGHSQYEVADNKTYDISTNGKSADTES